MTYGKTARFTASLLSQNMWIQGGNGKHKLVLNVHGIKYFNILSQTQLSLVSKSDHLPTPLGDQAQTDLHVL